MLHQDKKKTKNKKTLYSTRAWVGFSLNRGGPLSIAFSFGVRCCFPSSPDTGVKTFSELPPGEGSRRGDKSSVDHHLRARDHHRLCPAELWLFTSPDFFFLFIIFYFLAGYWGFFSPSGQRVPRCPGDLRPLGRWKVTFAPARIRFCPGLSDTIPMSLIFKR